MKRVFSTEKTCGWTGPMLPKAPENYEAILSQAPNDRILLKDLEGFLAHKPGLDKPCMSNSSRWWYEKLLENRTAIKAETIPHGVVVGREFQSFPHWVRSQPDWQNHVEIDGDNVVIGLKTNMYRLWDAVDAWTKYRQSKTGTKLDNGWYRHAVRLAARYQWWALTGTENWHPPASGRKAISKKRVREGEAKLIASPYFHASADQSKDERSAPPIVERIACNVSANEEPANEEPAKEEPAEEPAEVATGMPVGMPVAQVSSEAKAVVVGLKTACSGFKKVLDEIPLVNDATVRAYVSKANEFIDRKRNEGDESIEAPIIFFCNVPELANVPHEMKNHAVLEYIKAKFKKMTAKQFKRGWYGVEAYFKVHPKGEEYGYVMRNGWGSIDHVLPQYFGIFHHPRFMALMPPGVNAHLNNSPPIARMGFGLKRHEMQLMHTWMKSMEDTARKQKIQDMLLSDLVSKHPVKEVCA